MLAAADLVQIVQSAQTHEVKSLISAQVRTAPARRSTHTGGHRVAVRRSTVHVYSRAQNSMMQNNFVFDYPHKLIQFLFIFKRRK